jgi:signal transduction histidine kinase
MSLRQKMAIQIATMLIGALLLSGAALWGIHGLHQDYDLAIAGYRELRQLYGNVGRHLAAAQALLAAAPNERQRAAEEVEQAAQKFAFFQSALRHDSGEKPRDEQAENDIRTALAACLTQLRTPPQPNQPLHDVSSADIYLIMKAEELIGTFERHITEIIKERKDAADRKRHDTTLAVGAACLLVIAGAVVLGLLQYRQVMSPLNRLRFGVRKIAAGELKQRLDENGSQEFVELAEEFNKMASELDALYHQLEERVEQKSRELIRSERLAGVGYLAAGVAHEINNPISIIAGYAEYTLAQLKQQAAEPGNSDVAKSLAVICDEAFRCKDIVSKLLSLARPGEPKRSEIDLGEVARNVVAAVAGFGEYRDRKLAIEASSNDGLKVSAVEAEMKQVILNLTVNALEAVSEGGEVNVNVGRNDGWVELRVSDNGRGMSRETLDQIFEPFFTDKRGARQPGTGLGLSITHSIIESHGGRIHAKSDGAGKGSEFVVQLPAAQGSDS